MKIFIVTNPESGVIPFITLENAYKEMENYREYFTGQNFPSFEEIKKLSDERKSKGKDLYYGLSTPNEVYNLYIEECTLNP